MCTWLRATCCLLIVLCLHSCSQLPIEQIPSANQNSRIKAIVLHYTGANYQQSLNGLVKEGGLSAHYLVPESNDPSYRHNGLKIFQLVDEQSRAWHAGLSTWQNLTGLNDQSIGIEIINRASCPSNSSTSNHQTVNGQRLQCSYPEYDPQQITLLIALLTDILQRNPDIHPTAIVGHSDIAPLRKHDPGPRFPWHQLHKAGIGAWYEASVKDKYLQLFQQQLPSMGLTQTALRAYGYAVTETGIADENTLATIAALQMHFTPENLNGYSDAATNAVLFALLERYFPERVASLMERFNDEKLALTTPALESKFTQLHMQFPDAQLSSREYVNHRRRFIAYQGRGKIQIVNSGLEPVSADIWINGQQLNLPDTFLPNTDYQYSLHRRTVTGTNTIYVDNIRPAGAQITVSIPYPQIAETLDNGYEFDSVDSLIKHDIANGFPGAVLLVAYRGEIVHHKAYGYAHRYAPDGRELTQPIPMTKDTVFDLASNTKVFATTMAIMRLVEEHRLGLDTPLYEYLPEFRGNGRDALTARHLLTHSAGLAPEVHFFTPENHLGPEFYSQSAPLTKELLLTRVPLEERYQVAMRYSDSSFMLLGILVERITGMPLDQYVEQSIYRPLGLTQSVFNPRQKLPEPTRFAATELQGNTRGGRVNFENVRTYTLNGEVHDEKAYYSMQGVAGHAGLFSTAAELAQLTQLMLNGGGLGDQYLFSETVLNQFIMPSAISDTTGLGFRRAATGERRWQFGPYASERAFGHTGWTGTLSVIDPEHDLVIILLTNKRHTPIQHSIDTNGKETINFVGQHYETGQYGSIVSLIYETILHRGL